MSFKYTTETFVKMLRGIHFDRYDYSDVVYTKSSEKIIVGCLDHGKFSVSANDHQQGKGCPVCSSQALELRRALNKKPKKVKPAKLDKSQIKTSAFIAASITKYGDRFSYTNTKYINSKTKVSLTCGLHGDFETLPCQHLSGRSGCKCCGYAAVAKGQQNTLQDFLVSAEIKHGNKYLYDKTVYVTAKKPVVITCRACGDFKQSPTNHLSGQGCPKCSKTGYNRGKAGHVYVLSSGDMVKVGITNKGVSSRVIPISKSSGEDFSVLTSMFFEDGQIPFDIEKATLGWLRSNFNKVDRVFEGYTECFTGCNHNDVIDFVVNAAKCRDKQLSA